MDEFEALITEQIPRLRRYARMLLRRAERADDLVQDTLERSWAKRKLWQPGSDLRAWLFTIMHNLYVNQFRLREPESLDEDLDLPVPAAHEQTLALRDLNNALAQLNADYREVILLVAVEEMRYSEVAAVLNIPVGTVMSRLARGRERLRVLMGNETASTLRRIK